jgi:hypothetical protein
LLIPKSVLLTYDRGETILVAAVFVTDERGDVIAEAGRVWMLEAEELKTATAAGREEFILEAVEGSGAKAAAALVCRSDDTPVTLPPLPSATLLLVACSFRPLCSRSRLFSFVGRRSSSSSLSDDWNKSSACCRLRSRRRSKSDEDEEASAIKWESDLLGAAAWDFVLEGVAAAGGADRFAGGTFGVAGTVAVEDGGRDNDFPAIVVLMAGMAKMIVYQFPRTEQLQPLRRRITVGPRAQSALHPT